MEYTKEQYIESIKAFNKKDLEGKLQTIKNSDILQLGFDNGWSWVEIVGISEELKEEIEEVEWFDWDAEFYSSSKGLWILFDMAGIV